jgi:hypothetical protein
MKDSSCVEIIEDPVKEARRYVQNAKDVLKEKGQLDIETQFYQDRKYVRMAGNTLWNGVLLMLDAVFHVKTDDGTRPDIRDYRNAIVKRDLKLLTFVNVGYDIMHLSMGYDGNPYKANCQKGISLANEIIDRCAAMLPS